MPFLSSVKPVTESRMILTRWIGVSCAVGLLVAIVLTVVWQSSAATPSNSLGWARTNEQIMLMFWPTSLLMMGANDTSSLYVGWIFAAITNALLYGVLGAILYVGTRKTRWGFAALVVFVITWWWHSWNL